jgi:hypothetical protein
VNEELVSLYQSCKSAIQAMQDSGRAASRQWLMVADESTESVLTKIAELAEEFTKSNEAVTDMEKVLVFPPSF